MPLTPYHAGPSALLGLAFGRVLHVPVFFTASLAVDLEVPVYSLLGLGLGTPRYGHTLLIGGAFGLLWAIAMRPLEPAFTRTMRWLDLPHHPHMGRALLSGVLGAWLHVLLDGSYRRGAGIFWPSGAENPLCRFDRPEVEVFCAVLGAAGLLLYAGMRARKRS